MTDIFGLGILIIIVGMLTIFIVGTTLISAREMAIWFRLKRSGKRTEAMIEDLYVSRGSKSDEYFITFCPLTDEGRSVMQLITKRSYKRFQNQETVRVSYLPDLPAIARLSGQDDVAWGRGIYTVGAIAAIALFPPAVLLWLPVFATVYLRPALLIHPVFKRILFIEYIFTSSKLKRQIRGIYS